MKHYETELKLPLLQKHNEIFFKNGKFHGDLSYKILEIEGKTYLRVNTKLTGIVYYKIDPENYKLTYANL